MKISKSPVYFSAKYKVENFARETYFFVCGLTPSQRSETREGRLFRREAFFQRNFPLRKLNNFSNYSRAITSFLSRDHGWISPTYGRPMRAFNVRLIGGLQNKIRICALVHVRILFSIQCRSDNFFFKLNKLVNSR